MKSYQAQTTIEAPAQTVFEYVSDFAKHAEWSGNGLQVTKDSDEPVAVGRTYSTVAKQFGTQREHSTITELEPGKVFGWDSTGALGTVHHRFTVSSGDAGTDLKKTAEFVQRSFLAKLTSWKIGKDLPAGLRRDVERIKEHLESAKG